MEKQRNGLRISLLIGVATISVLVAIGLVYRQEICARYVLATQFDRLGGLADVLRFRYQMTEELQP